MAARPILTFLVLCTAATVARASPRSDPTAGRAVFTGATSPHASSISLNPAALGLGTVTEFVAGMTSVLDQFSIDRKQVAPGSGALSPGESVTGSELGLGGMFAVIFHPGTSYTVSFELRTPPPETFPTGHEALRFHTLGYNQRDFLATIGSTFRVTSQFYFGASLSHDNTSLRLRYARDTALADADGPRGIASDCAGAPCGFENPAAAEIYDVDVSSPWLATSNLKVNLGILAQIYRDVWLGIAYHTPPGFAIQSELDGTMRVARAPRDGGGTLRGGSSVYVSFPASVDLEVRARLPRHLDLRIGGRWEDLSRMQAYDVRGYGSTFPPYEVPEWSLRPRGMDDSFALWAGLEQIEFDQKILLGGRVGVESSALDDDRTSPLTIAPASFTADVGAQIRIAPTLSLQLTYGLQLFRPVSVTTSAFDPNAQLACSASGFDYSNSACEAVREGYAIPTAAGDYSRIQHAMRIGLRYEFSP